MSMALMAMLKELRTLIASLTARIERLEKEQNPPTLAEFIRQKPREKNVKN